MALLDYSAGKISAAAIKAAGFGGAIRYITDRNSLGTKHTSLAEYRDHVANGLQDWLVYEVGTNDPLGGRAGGVTAARRALDGASYIGYPTSRHIFFCFDRHATASELPAWQAYLDGASSVLGVGRVGAYGFSEAIDAARGHATAFWQCGSRSVVRNWTNFYQRNTGATVVGGITCDINDVLIPISEENLMAGFDGTDYKYLMWDATFDDDGKGHTQNFAQYVKGALRGGIEVTNSNAYAASTSAAAAKAGVDALAAQVSALQAKVDGLGTPQVDLDALAAKVAALVAPAVQAGLASAVVDEEARRLAN